MGCTSCGTGKPNGCKSNGGCSTGGCNRLNVHDWLANLPIDDAETNCRIVEISFNREVEKISSETTPYTFSRKVT